MLLAELFGKGREDLENDEDLLTSTVFGVLRYLPPSIFWVDFLAKARSGRGTTFLDRCGQLGVDIGGYSKVDIYPWRTCEDLGEPDLVVVFSGNGITPLCFLIESKLSSGKSWKGDEDQLTRYLRILQNARWLAKTTGIRGTMIRPGLVYLCARAAWSDIVESIDAAPDRAAAEQALFLVQWQDLLNAAREAGSSATYPDSQILGDVATFLEHRGLAYFRGFSEPKIPESVVSDARFYTMEGD